MSDRPTLESRGFLEQAPVGIVHATPEGHILRCNMEFADIIGYPREEVRGLMLQEITPDDDGVQAISSFKKLWTGGTDALSLEIRLIRRDASLTRTRFTVSLLRDREGWPSHLLAHVEAMGKAAEPQVPVSQEAAHQPIKENRYRSAFETSPDGVLIARAEDGRIVDANPAFLQIMSFNLEEVVGRTSVELDMWADDEDSRKVAEALQEEEVCRDVEVRLRRKKGEVFWAELSASFTE